MGGHPKALLAFSGETFLDRLIGLFQPVCSQLIVVLGHNSEQVRRGVSRNATFMQNPDPDRGQLSSLQCGFSALEADVERVFFTPVDYPVIRSETIWSLASAASVNSAMVVVPQHGGKHGHPVLIHRRLADEILALPLSATAREVIHRHVDRTVYMDVEDPGILLDVDDPAAYRALTQAVL